MTGGSPAGHEPERPGRGVRGDTPDKVWRDGLRVICDSVRLHSSFRPGDRGYLNFVSPFVP